jgi:hypothetical protein
MKVEEVLLPRDLYLFVAVRLVVEVYCPAEMLHQVERRLIQKK